MLDCAGRNGCRKDDPGGKPSLVAVLEKHCGRSVGSRDRHRYNAALGEEGGMILSLNALE